MSGLQANTGAMNANGQATVASSEYLQNELSSLRANVASLLSIWKGLSATEFNNSYLAQANNFNKFAVLLNDLGEAISKSANILNRTEEENADAGAHLFN